MTRDELEGKQGDLSFDEFFSDPAVQRGLKELAQAHKSSHLDQGATYRQQGRLREALEEFRKDTELEITTYALASVVQRAFCHMGDTFRLLGEFEHAVTAYTRGMETWQVYGYGEMPRASLAVAYLEQGQVDDAIRVCEEDLEEVHDPCVQQVLAEAKRLKAGDEPSPDPVRGCRRIDLPIRVTRGLGD